MPLSLSKRAALIAQSEIRAMTIACVKIERINLAQEVCVHQGSAPRVPGEVFSHGGNFLTT